MTDSSSRADGAGDGLLRQRLPVEADLDPMEMGLWWRICRSFAKFWVVALFDFKAYGVKNVPKRGGALLCGNHQSYLDPVLFGVMIPRPMSFMAKSELFKNRYFGWLIRSLHAFPVRQGKGDKAAIEETIRRLRDGHLLHIYPEGSRSEDGEIAPIQRGAALVVRRAGMPIVPAVVHGSFDAWPKGSSLFRPHPIRVLYGPPLRVEGLKSDQVVALLESTLRQMLADLRGTRRGVRLTAIPSCRMKQRASRRSSSRKRLRGLNMPSSTLEELTRLALAFRDERDWKQFHNPKDMALSLVLESAELLELMQWKNGSELADHLAQNKARLGEELSDVLFWVLAIASDNQIDITEEFKRKLIENAKKYPIEKARGVSTKYTKL